MSQQDHALLGAALALIVILYALDVTRSGHIEDVTPGWWRALVSLYVLLYCIGAAGFLYLGLALK